MAVKARLHCPEGPSKADIVRGWDAAKRKKFLRSLDPQEAYALEYDWDFWSRPKQREPSERFLTWLILAGRGFGKTRAGAQWALDYIQAGRAGGNRFAIVGRTVDDAAGIQVEGESGILACAPPWFKPKWFPSLQEVHFPNGVVGQVFGAHNPESFRGYQHGGYWADEMAAWDYPESFTQLQLGLRLGKAPQGCVTTTPRPKQHIRDLVDRATTILTRGTTYENLSNMAASFKAEILAQYEGTRMGAQELEAQLLMDSAGALWSRNLVEACRVTKAPRMRRIVVGIDPGISSKRKSDNTGIIVAGLGFDGLFYVLEDVTVNGQPHIWAKAAVTAYHKHKADRIVAEVNQGGEMVESTIAVADSTVAVRTVSATRNKQTRAEPVSMLYEKNLVRHVGVFPHLEDEMCIWDPNESTDSPDRLDAMVWAMTDLMGSRKHPGAINLTQGDGTIRNSPYKDL